MTPKTRRPPRRALPRSEAVKGAKSQETDQQSRPDPCTSQGPAARWPRTDSAPQRTDTRRGPGGYRRPRGNHGTTGRALGPAGSKQTQDTTRFKTRPASQRPLFARRLSLTAPVRLLPKRSREDGPPEGPQLGPPEDYNYSKVVPPHED